MPADASEPGSAAAPVSSRRAGARRRRVPGGRPYTVSVDLSEDEFRSITERASEVGLSVGAYIAAAAEPRTSLGIAGMPAAERRAWASELMAVRQLLAAVGNNTNQLARAANSGARVDPGAAAATISACDRAAARVTELLERLLGGRTGQAARRSGGVGVGRVGDRESDDGRHGASSASGPRAGDGPRR